MKLQRFLYGSPYYPEHWDAATRQADPQRMKAAGWNVVRMAEFAWDLMEPQQGQYDFTLFDETIQRMGKEGIQTILCTPTATPPRWLTHQHPEILRVDENGRTMQHGSRQHACTANLLFRDYSKRITRAMALHYRDNPDVISWQTDNEFHCHFSECHCPACQQAFRRFLTIRYQGQIGTLNNAWGTAFWAQTYTSFDEIETPRPAAPTYINPSQQLDYYRFLSWAVTQFQHDQVEILRQVNPEWIITHNGLFRHIDYHGPFTQDLDVLGYDSYPMFSIDPVKRSLDEAFNLDHTRAYSGNFILLEQQSGPGGQAPYFHDNPEPGEMRRMAYTSIARGADSLLFFRWRTCRFGAEEYWCGILDHDNIPRRRYAEASQLGNELKIVGAELLGTSVRVDVGIAAVDFDAYEAHLTLPFGMPDPKSMAAGIHASFLQRGYAVGCVHPADNLEHLQLYILPHWEVFDPAWLDNLTRFVERGGVLIIGARTATRDLNNHVVSQSLPGVLRELAGLTVEDYGHQNSPETRPLSLKFSQHSVATQHWFELLNPAEGTQVLARWQGRYLQGQPAVTARAHGAGWVIYAGTYLTPDVMQVLMEEIAPKTALRPLLDCNSPELQVTCRQDQDKRLWFVINHGDSALQLNCLPAGVDLISGKRVAADMELPLNGVMVIKEDQSPRPV